MTHLIPFRSALKLAACLALSVPAHAQLAQRTDSTASTQIAAPHRTRLILKDGTYQLILSYTVVGKMVRYVSAERNGSVEDIPLSLVNLDATARWAKDHPAVDPNAPLPAHPIAIIDPELAKEEAARATLSPEIAPDLHLPPDLSVLALDTFRDTPELIPLTQSDGELNKQTSHNILHSKVNPAAVSHPIITLKNEGAAVELHVNDPAFYVKLDDVLPASGGALTVDTHGASSQTPGQKPSDTDYVVVRVDVRQDARVVPSVNPQLLGTGKRQEDVIECDTTVLPGGHWAKIVPQGKLLAGEYALLEILDEKSVNLSVWDFGIHPTSPENRDALKPTKQRSPSLERRP